MAGILCQVLVISRLEIPSPVHLCVTRTLAALRVVLAQPGVVRCHSTMRRTIGTPCLVALVGLSTALLLPGCSQAPRAAARRPPTTGTTSSWLRSEDHEVYQVPDSLPGVDCVQPGPKFKPEPMVGMNTAEVVDDIPAPTILLARQQLDSELPNPLGPTAPQVIMGEGQPELVSVTRERRGVPPIGGYDSRPVPYAAQSNGLPPIRLAGQAIDDTSWCLDPKK